MNRNDRLSTVFVGDLSKFCVEQDLANLFAPYGPILNANIKKNHVTGKTLSYGFVTLTTEELAKLAIDELDGIRFGGRQIK